MSAPRNIVWIHRLAIPILTLGAIACGGPPINVAPASIVSVAPAPAPAPTVDETRNDRSQSAEASDGSGSGSGSENATDECPWDLQAMHRRGINANYLLPPILEAMMSWTVSAEPDAGDQLTVRFSLRDENGLQAGAEHYSCHREGLRLTAVTTAIRRVTFEPPLLVLPSTEGNREAHGRIVFNDDGNEEILAYSWSSVTQNAGVVDEYSGSSGLRRRVTSVLDTGSERHARRWSTMTEWLVTAELVVATRRFQTVGIDDESAAREERLDVLYQGDERVY